MDETAFLRAILDDPDDDAPRLVFADWLDDRGDHARAEFIRVQCRLAALPEDHPDRPALAMRGASIEAAHRNAWLGPLSQVGVVFRRGFADQLTSHYSSFNLTDEHLAALPAVAPLLSSLELGWQSAVTDDGLAPLARLPLLRRLDAGNCPVTDAGLRHLHGLPLLVEVLSWSGTMTEEGLSAQEAARREAFAGLPPERRRAEALRMLPAALRPGAEAEDLSVSDGQLALLEELPEVPGVQSLRLHYLSATGEGLRHLRRFPDLRSLDLAGSPLAGIAGLAGMTRLRSLNLEDTGELTDDGAEALGTLTGLESLVLWDTGGGDATLHRLAALPRLECLTVVAGSGGVTRDGLASLAGLAGLRALCLWCPASLVGELSVLARLPALRVLKLVINDQVSFDAAALVARVGSCAGLSEVEFQPNPGYPFAREILAAMADALPRASVCVLNVLAGCRHVVPDTFDRREVGGCSLEVPAGWEPRERDPEEGEIWAASLNGVDPDFCEGMARARLGRRTTAAPEGDGRLVFNWPADGGWWTLTCRAGPDRSAAWEPVFRRMAASFRPAGGG